MLTIVRLGGELAKQFGKEFRLHVRKPVDAFKLLAVNFPAFRQTLQDYARQGLHFRITAIGDRRRDISEGELCLLQKPKVLRIVPLISGASGDTRKSNVKIAAAAVLAIVGTALSGGSAAPMLGAFMKAAAFGLAMSGASEIYMRQAAKKNKTELQERQPGSLFGNLGNRMESGGPVPVGYGTMRVGSNVISVTQSVETKGV